MTSASLQPQIHASENWDDDFEFQQETNKSERHPRQRHAGVTHDARKLSIASSTALEDWDADERPLPVSQPVLHQQHVEHQTENWDDDFEDGRSSPHKVVDSNLKRQKDSWDDDVDPGEETENDSVEFGFAEREDDRTVTAKSRRAALKRLSSSSNSPPPMPPPLPINFLVNTQPGPYRTLQQPFPPRSPSSSLFSIPTTLHTIQTHDHYYSSTTHLRPTSAFALLPPSPPIHKERERRRLRKKSRPKPQGMFELTSLRSGSSINASASHLGLSCPAGPSQSNRTRYSFSDDGDPDEPSRLLPDIMRLRTGTPTDTSSADDRRAVTPALTAPSLPQTPAKGTALLSRIGSVKKWGARRKRASTTPSEFIADESNNADVNRTPRVKSSRASFHANVPSSRNSISTPPPPQELTSTSKSHTDTDNHTSNRFFRASSAGSPHTCTGGRAGGRTSSQGNRGQEEADGAVEDRPGSRQRSGSVIQNRSRSRTGRIGSYLNGSRTDLSHTPGEVASTPGKLAKRKSLGFIQLRKSVTASKEEKEPDGNDSPRKARYIGIGLGRATGRGVDGETCDGDASEPEGDSQAGAQQERRRRRKSFSRFLFDRDKENESNPSSKSEAPEKAKDGSRGFMGSMRRISLVSSGKHKRTKSGNGILKAPPLPSSSLITQQSKPSSPLPYSLPPVRVTSSQLSLRLPSSTSSSGKQPFSQTGSVHDLPSTLTPPALPPSRTVSGASTQASNTSSVLPLSSISSLSSRNRETLPHTPRPPQRNRSTRSRTSEESTRPRKSASSRRQSLDVNGVSFLTKLSQAGDKIKEPDVAPLPQQEIPSVGSSPALVTPSSPPTLLPPIELQPPSPPRSVAKEAKTDLNILITFESSPISKLSVSASSSSVFFTPASSPQHHPVALSSPNLKTSKLHVPLSPHSGKSPLLQQSASLGRATTAGSALSNSPQDGELSPNGGAPHPRRNSLGDLKIPARISQAQVGLRRDLGMVREFANNIEQLKDLQRTYDALVAEIQSILDSHVVRHEQQLTSPEPAAEDAKRPVANKSTTLSETNEGASVTPAQIAYKELASAFYVINSKYRITWECADLLIELGGGNTNDDISSPPTSASAPIVSQFTAVRAGMQGSIGTKHGRERAITLAGDEPNSAQPALVASPSVLQSSDADYAPPVPSPSNSSPLASPPSLSWRTSTGRHNLSQRQLVLLREMINNGHAHSSVGADTDVGANSQADTSIALKSFSPTRSHQHPHMLQVTANAEWRWGDPKNSTVTLPSEDSGQLEIGKASADHKRRSGKLGMSGLRDMLRALKRSAITEESAAPPVVATIPVQSTTSLSTESSTGSRKLRKPRQPSQRRKLRTGTGQDSVRSASENAKGQGVQRIISPYGASLTATKPSPRRPSLASIFRIGSKNRSSNATNVDTGPPLRFGPAYGGVPFQSSGTGEDSSSPEEDWDRMDSASDLDIAAKALGVIDGSSTVRGESQRDGRNKKSPYLQEDCFSQPGSEQAPARALMTKKSFGTSQVSIRGIEHPSLDSGVSQSGNVLPRPARLSNVEEHADDAGGVHAPSSARSISQAYSNVPTRLHKSAVGPTSITKSGSVRSMPAHVTSAAISPLTDSKHHPLAMTPENIKPLLDNAKEVQAKLGECIVELRALVSYSIEPGDT